MIKDRYHQKVIFGYGDKETAEKLRAFYKKHTGSDVDFNAMRNPKSGFALLVFCIPLGKIEQTNITVAARAPSSVRKFAALMDFIDWYENQYLPNRITIEQIEKNFIIPISPTNKKK